MKTKNEFVIRGNLAVKTDLSPARKTRLEWLLKNGRQSFAIGLAVGLVIGLVILGWWLFPVQWTDVPYDLLGTEEKAVLLEMASDLNAYGPASERVQDLAARWGEIDDLACAAAGQEPDPARRVQFMALAYYINGHGCIQ
jgi:hypothetical protein